MSRTLLLLAFILCAALHATSAVDVAEHDQDSPILRKVSEALGSGDIFSLSQFFASKVHLDLFTGESGPFSSEQATVILRGFFQRFSPSGFDLRRSSMHTNNPYCIGDLSLTQSGRSFRAQVYIAFSSQQGRLRITQITITTL